MRLGFRVTNDLLSFLLLLFGFEKVNVVDLLCCFGTKFNVRLFSFEGW